MEKTKIREAVGIFANEESLDAAVSELEATAFPRHDISILGSKKMLKKAFGSDVIDPRKAENDPEVPRGIPVMPEEKALGAAALVGCCAYIGGCIAAVATNSMSDAVLLSFITGGSMLGGIIGIATVAIIRAVLKRDIEKQIKKGGLVLWVHTPEEKFEKIASFILKKHGGKHIHIHEIQQR